MNSSHISSNSESVSNEQMFEGDALYEVTSAEEMKDQLHKYIGPLHARNGSGYTIYGTAFLISCNLLLTVAHNFIK